MNADTRELVENLVGCFHKNHRGWYEHKDNDSNWIKVSEDLQDYLEEAQEMLRA